MAWFGKKVIKLEALPRLLALGLTVEQVAQALGLSVDKLYRDKLDKFRQQIERNQVVAICADRVISQVRSRSTSI